MNEIQIKLTHWEEQYNAQIRTLFETAGGNCDEDIMLVDKFKKMEEFQAIVSVEFQKTSPRIFFTNYLPDDNIIIIIKKEELPKFKFLLS